MIEELAKHARMRPRLSKHPVIDSSQSGLSSHRGHQFKDGKCVHCAIEEKVVRYLGVRCRKAPQQFPSATAR